VTLLGEEIARPNHNPRAPILVGYPPAIEETFELVRHRLEPAVWILGPAVAFSIVGGAFRSTALARSPRRPTQQNLTPPASAGPPFFFCDWLVWRIPRVSRTLLGAAVLLRLRHAPPSAAQAQPVGAGGTIRPNWADFQLLVETFRHMLCRDRQSLQAVDKSTKRPWR